MCGRYYMDDETDGRGILINARAETAMERHTFKESVLHRRCVIPAKGFWEWNKSKGE